jgi:hypothetical protein
MAKIDMNTSCLDDALAFCGQRERYRVADALYCHLHNTGQYLAGNTADTDVEWMARDLYEDWISRRPGPDKWEHAAPEHRSMFDELARVCIEAMPRLQRRIAGRLIEMSKVIQDIERAEQAAYKAKGGG